jgi:hypothetical protein
MRPVTVHVSTVPSRNDRQHELASTARNLMASPLLERSEAGVFTRRSRLFGEAAAGTLQMPCGMTAGLPPAG